MRGPQKSETTGERKNPLFVAAASLASRLIEPLIGAVRTGDIANNNNNTQTQINKLQMEHETQVALDQNVT